jgi:hypothetical protein
MKIVIGLHAPVEAKERLARYMMQHHDCGVDEHTPLLHALMEASGPNPVHVQSGSGALYTLIVSWKKFSREVPTLGIAALSPHNERYLDALLGEFRGCLLIEVSIAEEMQHSLFSELAEFRTLNFSDIWLYCVGPSRQEDSSKDKPRSLRNLVPEGTDAPPEDSVTVTLLPEQCPSELLDVVYADVPEGGEYSNDIGGRHVLFLASLDRSRRFGRDRPSDRSFTFFNSSALGVMQARPLPDKVDLLSRIREGKVRVVTAVGEPTGGREM